MKPSQARRFAACAIVALDTLFGRLREFYNQAMAASRT
jgi:hypothetical protein